ILCTLGKAGHHAVLIGGVVRDGLLEAWGADVTYPPDDVDIATSALPAEIRALFRGHPIVAVGEEFGVVVIISPNGHPYEVATFRTEGEYDGRWPANVSLVRDLEADVRRRDLTINGLAADAEGRVTDLVGGVADLRARRVRAIGDSGTRFAEDHLRMLRVVRFVCQIDGLLDEDTARAVADHAEEIVSISGERIRDELLRILETPRAHAGLALLDKLGLLRPILPELVAGKGVPQPEEYHPEGDVFVHTLESVRVADAFVRDALVKLAVVLHDIGKPEALARNRGANMGGHCAVGAGMVQRIARRLRLSRSDTLRLAFLVKNHMRIADFPEMGRGKQVRFLTSGEGGEHGSVGKRYPMFVDLLRVLVADCEASAHRSSGWAPVLRETLRVVDHVERVGDLSRARRLIDGNDLIRLGMPPGPRLGEILEFLQDRVLAGEIAARSMALHEAETLIRRALDETQAPRQRDTRPRSPDAPSLL
ncbi:MAG: CCA tRNA nucleotidyltransferase, partial [Candidatus Bipolaricaulis sp.]|nr:CCA tRNA nucleotidyltransferase [Candidatus Bipolaricaulis sp.]